MSRYSHIVQLGLTSLGWLLLLATFGRVFLATPIEANMGIVQKIFYFHVPAAYITYLAWTVCAIASIGYLWRHKEKLDMVAVSAAELALIFAIIVMTTGPLWGRKSWGAYWTWDPRLTTMLLLTLIIIAYVALRALAHGEPERRFAAALSILGLSVTPLIHFSVQKWRGQHPAVITGKGGGLAPEMLTTFGMAMLAFTIIFFSLLWHRYQLEKSRRAFVSLTTSATAHNMTEDVES